MILPNVFNQVLNISAASGDFCPIMVPDIGVSFDSVYYVIQTGAGVTAGSVGIRLLLPLPGSPISSGTWIQTTIPNSATGSAFNLISTLGANATYIGSLNISGAIFVPSHGLRFIVSGLTGGNITLMQLFGTLR